MAMPTAAGTIQIATAGRTFPPIWKRGLFAMKATTANAPAKANHLSWARSSPVARRSRRTRETDEAIPRRNRSRIPPTCTLYATSKETGDPAGASSPMFARIGPLMGQPVTAMGMTVITRATAASHATGFHRRDGSRPSGKSRSRYVNTRMMPGGQAHVPSHAMMSPPGSDPGSVINAYTAYSPERLASAKERPTPQRIHPIGLPGRRDAIRAPTTENARTAGIPRIVKASNEEAATPTARVPAIAAAATMPIDQASQLAVRDPIADSP